MTALCPNHLRWMRQTKSSPTAHPVREDEPPIAVNCYERIHSTPLYQRGPFAVVDTIANLEYAVVDVRTMTRILTVRLDLTEAMAMADALAWAEPTA